MFQCKFLVKGCTLTYFEHKYVSNIEIISQKSSLFCEIRTPFQNAIFQLYFSLMDGQTWSLKISDIFWTEPNFDILSMRDLFRMNQRIFWLPWNKHFVDFWILFWTVHIRLSIFYHGRFAFITRRTYFFCNCHTLYHRKYITLLIFALWNSFFDEIFSKTKKILNNHIWVKHQVTWIEIDRTATKIYGNFHLRYHGHCPWLLWWTLSMIA